MIKNLGRCEIAALREQLAAKDLLIAAMRYNIEEKGKFIEYLQAQLGEEVVAREEDSNNQQG